MNIYENLPLTPNDMFSMMTWVLIVVLIWFIFDFISGDKY